MSAPRVDAKIAGLARKRKPRSEPPPIVLTIGHSTRTLEEFICLLQAHGVRRVVDVRTVPRSLHNPQFNNTSLPESLNKAGLAYVHMPGLGGLRRANPDSINMGWRNASFRGYADYMQTPEERKTVSINSRTSISQPKVSHKKLIIRSLRSSSTIGAQSALGSSSTRQSQIELTT